MQKNDHIPHDDVSTIKSGNNKWQQWRGGAAVRAINVATQKAGYGGASKKCLEGM